MATGTNSLTKLRFMTYNSRGFNDSKRMYIAYLLSSCDILYVQEHWLSEEQLAMLNGLSSVHLTTGVSGFSNKDVLSGRPYGGCSIFWRRDLKLTVTQLATTSRRISALLLCGNDFKMICVNAYMPCEPDVSSLDELSFQLSVVQELINKHSDCHIVLGGDLNVDFARVSAHTSLLNDFCSQAGLLPTVHHPCSKVDYTYNFGMRHFSVIDHFILSEQLFRQTVCNVYAVHDIDNVSDHDPLYMELSISVARFTSNDKVYNCKPSWAKATAAQIDAYKDALRKQLQSIYIPYSAVTCTNVCCSDKSHFASINHYVECISKACLNAAECTVPYTRARGDGGCIPGWSELVAPYRSKSLFSHNLWVECGKPRTGVVYDIMRQTRARYHHAIRNARRNEDEIVNERFGDALLHKKAVLSQR